ncbi:MAG: hypothetical protein HYZ37_07950 [Candidatus Solibacter usitatus]|nr:hypothetical protein [Candidatus Solibacter usitatus]
MDSPPVGGLVLAIDHDRFFKELLTTFFVHQSATPSTFPRRVFERHRDRQAGSAPGNLRHVCAVLLDVLTARFGPPDAQTTRRVSAIDSIEELRTLTRRAITSESLHDL